MRIGDPPSEEVFVGPPSREQYSHDREDLRGWPEHYAENLCDRLEHPRLHTLKQQEHRHVTVMPELNADWIRDLKAQSGKDICLFGGSSLSRSFFDSGLVDGVEVAVIPILLGAGIPLLPPPYSPIKLRLTSHHLYRSARLSLALKCSASRAALETEVAHLHDHR
jgi:dihydrofolate reductase